MSIPKLFINAAFGINTLLKNPRDPFLFIDDETIVFTAGTNLVRFHFPTKAQQILPCSAASSSSISGITISADRQFIGVIVKEQRSTVLFVDVAKFSSKQTLYRLSDSADGRLPVCFYFYLFL